MTLGGVGVGLELICAGCAARSAVTVGFRVVLGMGFLGFGLVWVVWGVANPKPA